MRNISVEMLVQVTEPSLSMLTSQDQRKARVSLERGGKRFDLSKYPDGVLNRVSEGRKSKDGLLLRRDRLVSWLATWTGNLLDVQTLTGSGFDQDESCVRRVALCLGRVEKPKGRGEYV